DGKLVREIRIVYNIQYDYWRRQEWKAGALIYDSLGSKGEGDTGHLQWEYSLQEPPDDWKNPYPDNYEPAKKEGCDMFHWEGYKFDAYLYENFEEHFASESEELAKNPFNPELARKKRLEYGKVIGVTIPYDSRFID
ncbi:MAG: hypothetical protein MJ014_02655, partial [Methanocorpusculum sp.]|nr:hypothetical protein [Methanocorpusculum sp.]